MNLSEIAHFSLGQKTTYPKSYDPDVLVAIPRSFNREKLELNRELPFTGYDFWNCYELSFLNRNGLPVAALCSFQIPCTSDNLIESKSLKLYLNSFNFTKIESFDKLIGTLRDDLSSKLSVSRDDLKIDVYDLSGSHKNIKSFFINSSEQKHVDYVNLEHENHAINIDSFDYNPDYLVLDEQKEFVREKLCSHLLKSNCLVTQQPDWGSVYIHYEGEKINHSELLRYIVSFRNHNEFHEMCVERIFTDLMRKCRPEKLTVFARYTRRGGIDINPFRSNFESLPDVGRTIRQ